MTLQWWQQLWGEPRSLSKPGRQLPTVERVCESSNCPTGLMVQSLTINFSACILTSTNTAVYFCGRNCLVKKLVQCLQYFDHITIKPLYFYSHSVVPELMSLS